MQIANCKLKNEEGSAIINLQFAICILQSLVLLQPLAAIADSAQPNAPIPLYPKALAPGDTIMFIAPAKYLNKERMSLARRRLEEMGFKVRTPETLFRKKGFLAGSDDERAAELMAAFEDFQIDAIFPGTGGYGTTRIIDKLDYDIIRRNPKIFIGFSDITALHVAINQRTGLVTFHSPNPEWGLGGETNLSPFAAKWFWRALLAANYDDLLANSPRAGASAGYTIETRPRDAGKSDDATLFDGVPRPVTICDGTARGRLIGGNLSVLHALMGTPYEIQTDGRILFLEDVGEAPYRVDRMLNTLRLAGKFDHVAGIILGAFTAREEEAAWDDDATIDDVLRDYFANLGVPVLAHFPVGHVRYNATLPIGALAELDATAQTLRLLENPTETSQTKTAIVNKSSRTQTDARRPPTLVGSWKSDLEKTMQFNNTHAKLSERQIIAFNQIFGRNIIEFSEDICTIRSPAVTIRQEDKVIELEPSNDILAYEVIGRTPTAIAILSEDSDKLKTLSIWHFEGEYIWTYVGDSPFGSSLHVREYFKRLK